MEKGMEFFRGKRVFITGHTGFKGTWLCELLTYAGAQVTGYALEPPTVPSLFDLCRTSERMHHIIGDVRDFKQLKQAYESASPEIVFHLAAQPLVRESYRDPKGTYDTNVMGTVNLLECVRMSKVQPRSVVIVTTDKVYENREWVWGYRENERLNGYDPYSNSKSCAELATRCYQRSFFADGRLSISTARAGNVIGGGDFAKDRILPDCVRAAQEGRSIAVRSPNSIRPYQHVLDALYAYLIIAEGQYQDPCLAGCYNVGPDEDGYARTGELVRLFCESWGNGQTWECKTDNGPHEAGCLKLDCAKLKSVFGWRPCWRLPTAVKKTVQWTQAYLNGSDVRKAVTEQIAQFLDCVPEIWLEEF